MRRVTLSAIAQEVKSLEAQLERVQEPEAEDARAVSRAAAALALSAARMKHRVPGKAVPRAAARKGRHKPG